MHSCHGRGRQVEVLRDAILHRLAEDPDLEPRDIIVMCPDIEHFAPLIQATFGAYDEEGGHSDGTRQLKIRLADRSLRQTNPVMGVLAEVLELATARMTVSQVLDLAGREPVRRRFRLADEDLARLEQWVRESNVRWGFDAAHRQAFKLGRVGANTWRSGLDRVLLGVAMAEDGQRLFAETLPLDDVESGDIELAGRLAEFVERLQHRHRPPVGRPHHARVGVGACRDRRLADDGADRRGLATGGAHLAPRAAGRRGDDGGRGQRRHHRQ